MVFYSTADPRYNTTAPTGKLADSGWQWVGFWDGSIGTPIGPHHFLTAHHIAIPPGKEMQFHGVGYQTTAIYDDAASDLRIVEINGEFPTWAPLYRADNEAGRRLIVIGHGDGRGNQIVTNGHVCGWGWGEPGVLRWGENVVVATPTWPFPWGPMLQAIFDPAVGRNVVDLAGGDSGSPIFIDDGTGWKLAGIAATVDGALSTTPEGPGFEAAIFDARGLYRAGHRIVAPLPVRTGFYATRVSRRAAWIDSILSKPFITSDSTDLPTISTPPAK